LHSDADIRLGVAAQDKRRRGLVETIESGCAGAVGAHQCVVDGVWRGVLHKTGPVEQKIRQTRGDSGVPVGLACAKPTLVTEPGESHTGWLYLAATNGSQAIHREALAIIRGHEASADEVVLGSSEDVFLCWFDYFLGVLSVVVRYGSHFIAILNFFELIQEAFGWDVVERCADDVELAVLGLVACDDADSGVLHFPDGIEHPHAEFKPAEVLRRCGKDTVDIPGSLEVSGKRGAHRAEDNRRDFSSVLGDVVDVRPRTGTTIVQAHAGNHQPIRRSLLELFEVCANSVIVVERLTPDVKLDTELFGGRGKYPGVLALTCCDVVCGAGPAHPVFFNLRARKDRLDERFGGGLRLGSVQRRGEVEQANFGSRRHSACSRQEAATIHCEGAAGIGTVFVSLHCDSS